MKRDSFLSIYFILYEKVYNVSKVMKMRKYKNQFEKMTQTPIPQLILILSLPTTLSMLVTNIYNMADTLFVSHLGTSASGAIGIVFGLMAILQAFGFMFGHGAGSNISRRLGARKVEEARKFASTSFYLSIFFGICISIFGFVFNNPLLYLLGSTDTILPYAKTYAFFILLAAPAMTSSCVMNNILRYEGKATFAMIGLVSGGILNIFGDALFMYGMNMGIEGAGLSTAISQYISAFILFSMFLRKKTQSRFYIKDFTRDYHDVLNIIAVGMPSMMRQGLNSVSTMVLNQQASVYGDAAIAAMSIIARICNFIFSFGLGIAQGFQPVSAFNYGAKLYKRVKESYFFTVIFSVCLIAVVSIICFIFSTQFISMFRNDTDVISIGTSGLRLQCATLIFLPISVCSNMLFQSMGKSSQATFLAAMRSGMCFIPLIYILPHLFGITGIILAQPVSDVVSALISIPFVYHFFKELSASKTANI